MLLYMGQREGRRKVKARMRRKFQRKQVSHCWKGQGQMECLFFSHLFCGAYESCGSLWFYEGFKFVVGSCDLWYKAEWLFHRYYKIACNFKGLASMSPFQSYVPHMLMIHTCSAHLEFFTDGYLLHISPLSSRMFSLLLLLELASKVPY